jgi:hypothetical protein
MVIALGVLASAAIGVVLAVRSRAGAGSRDELIRRTFAALATDDVDGLVELSGGDAAPIDCHGRLGDRRKTFARMASHASKLELDAIEILDAEATPSARGETYLFDCRFNRDVTYAKVQVQLSVGERGRAHHRQRVRVDVAEAGGRWYLLLAPRLFAVTKGMTDGLIELGAIRDRMCACTDTACAEAADDTLKHQLAELGPLAALPAHVAESVTERTAEIARCRTEAASGTGVPGACVAYAQLLDKLIACPALTASRGALEAERARLQGPADATACKIEMDLREQLTPAGCR